MEKMYEQYKKASNEGKWRMKFFFKNQKTKKNRTNEKEREKKITEKKSFKEEKSTMKKKDWKTNLDNVVVLRRVGQFIQIRQRTLQLIHDDPQSVHFSLRFLDQLQPIIQLCLRGRNLFVEKSHGKKTIQFGDKSLPMISLGEKPPKTIQFGDKSLRVISLGKKPRQRAFNLATDLFQWFL